MTDIFELLDDEYVDVDMKQKPFYKMLEDKKNDKEILDWLNVVSDALVEQSEHRTRVQRANLMTYRGVSMRKHDRFRNRERNLNRLNKIQKFKINEIYDLTETKVSQMTRLKPAVEVLPTNDEWEDRASAKVVQQIVKHLWYINDVDGMVRRLHREARIFGESYLFALWDKNEGDLHPAYVAARDAGMDVNDPKLQAIKNVGDICYEHEMPWRVLLQRTFKMDDVEYLFRVKLEPTEKLKDGYPKKAKEIKETDHLRTFDTDSLSDRFVEQHTLVMEFYHKHTEDMENGYYAKFTKDVMLENGDLPFVHGQLPIIRLTDLDVPDILNGISRYEQIAPIQRMYDNINTLIAKNIYLTAHAKWMMPRGTCKIEQLGNDNTIIQYQGNIPPQLVQTAPNSAEVYAYKEQLKEDMQRIYGSHGISRGEIPKGITAASALQFLNELENERASTDISKHGKLIKDIAKMTIAIVGEKYDVDDGRMIRIVGENNKFLIRHFDAAHLHKSYDIRFDNSTGLPETKSAKYQRILDAMQRNPAMLSPERWEYLLELADTEKMHTLISEAIKAADSENEDMMAERDVAMPEEHEDHIKHWESHVMNMQSRQYKEEASPIARAKLKDHVFYTERAIIYKMRNNPEFEAKVATLTLFPIYSHPDYVPARSMEQQMAMVQGQANRGDMVTGQIPGANAQDIIETQNAKDNLRRK
jgi:hypothetical protein